MVTNEDGILSIEATLVLPIFILILLAFAYLINYMTINDSIINNVIVDMLNSNLETYYEYKNNIPIQIKLNPKYESYKMNEFQIKNEIDNNKIKINISYIYRIPIKLISNIEVNKNIESKIFLNGVSLKDYGLASEYIKSDYDLWMLSNINRGKKFNELLDGTLDFDGSSIDKIYNGYLVSIVSLDFRKKTYTTDNAVINKLKGDINKLYNFNEGNILNTYVSKEDYNGKIFNLILPNDNYDENIKEQLMIAKIYCNNKNIQFKITIIE